jgi:hypothetical protein
MDPQHATQWVAAQADVIGVIGVLFLGALLILFLSARGHAWMMAHKRAHSTIDTFVRELSEKGYNARICRAVYEYLQTDQKVNFPINPDDALDERLGIAGDDLEQTIRDVLILTEREFCPGLLYRPLVTVEDLVRYVEASPLRLKKSA